MEKLEQLIKQFGSTPLTRAPSLSPEARHILLSGYSRYNRLGDYEEVDSREAVIDDGHLYVHESYGELPFGMGQLQQAWSEVPLPPTVMP